jgi:hypothetical protein
MFWVTVTVFENSRSRSVSYSAGFTKSAVMNWRDAPLIAYCRAKFNDWNPGRLPPPELPPRIFLA